MPFSTSLEDQLCFALYRTSNALTRFYRPHLNALGLTYPQYLTMLALWEEDRVTVKDLGARLGLDSGTVTPLLKRLEKVGLISRQRDEQDERRVFVSLTVQGTALAEQAADLPERVACAVGLAPDEIQGLIEQLEAVRHNVQVVASEEAREQIS